MPLDVTLARVALAGALGALAMAFTTALFNAIRVPVVDFGRLIATKILRYHSHGTRLGLVLHVLNGVVLAFVYALVFSPLLQLVVAVPAVVSGLAYGLFLWLLMMVVVLPALGDGLFGRRANLDMGPSGLFVHVLYGLILGLAGL